MDRRVTACNGRVADIALRGTVTADQFVQPRMMTCAVTVADLLAEPAGRRDRQIQYGATLNVFEEREGWAFVQSVTDRYVGYVALADLGAFNQPTHFVATPATHAYEAENMKSRDLLRLGFGARLTVNAERQSFFETECGFVPKKHLRPLDKPFADPVTVAQMHFGVPYLWGGNSTLGIDCSGLVQTALLACDAPCPGDSDMQQAELGHVLADEEPMRGDLYFWKGHVAMAVDADTLIHANAHHMAVAYEPIASAILRISAQGDGAVICRKRR